MSEKVLDSMRVKVGAMDDTYINNPKSVAGQFSVSKAYAAGDYVYYNRKLYCFTAAHAAGAWTGSDASEATVTGELSALKADLEEFTSISPITWVSNGYVNLTTNPIDVTTITQNQSWMCAVVQCSEGDQFIVNAFGGNAPRAYAFVDNNGTALALAGSQVRLTNTVITAPKNTAYLIINNQNHSSSKDYVCYTGAPVADVITPIKSDVNELKNEMLDIYDKSIVVISTSGYVVLKTGINVDDKYKITNNTTGTIAIVLTTGASNISITNNLAVNASIEFTATDNADSIRTYINTGITGSVVVLNMTSYVPELQERVAKIDTNVVDMNAVINGFLNPINNSSSMWEMGSFTYSGNKISADDRCRTIDYISTAIESVRLIDTSFFLYVFGWDEMGSCVGFWRPSTNEWINDNNTGLANNNYINFAELCKKYPGYKYKLVLMKTGIDITKIADTVKFGHYIPALGEYQWKPMLTFIDDDGYSASAQNWEEIADECNIPVTMALITSNVDTANHTVTWADVQRLQNKGFEFISHTHNHISLNDPSYTEQTVTEDFIATITALEAHGCESKYLVYPYTQITNANKAIVKKYFELGISLQNLLNEPYIDKQLVHRYDINKGTGEKEINGQTYTVHLFRTLEEYKEIIDNAVLHNGWIVFMSHLRNTPAGDQYYYDSDVKTLIESVIEYAKIKNVEIVTVAEAYKMYNGLMN